MLKKSFYLLILFFILAAAALVSRGGQGSTVLNVNQPTPDKDVTILILGEVGSGGEGGRWNEAVNLADAIVLLRYLPADNIIELISIPRDLYGNFGGDTFKVNEVIVRNKIPALLDKLPEITGFSTDKYLIADLDLVKQIVDAIGGVDVTLADPVTDSVSGYIMPAGPRHLNGDDVIWLIRNRFAPQGDFFREKNQHLIIEALSKKFISLSFADRMSLFFTLVGKLNNLQTNAGLGVLFPKAADLSKLCFQSVVLDFGTGLLNGGNIDLPSGGQEYALIPKAGMDNYTDVRNYINLQLQSPH